MKKRLSKAQKRENLYIDQCYLAIVPQMIYAKGRGLVRVIKEKNGND